MKTIRPYVITARHRLRDMDAVDWSMAAIGSAACLWMGVAFAVAFTGGW
ncbi:hypothetical protein KITKAT_65 [Arthrobacter phage Kitkat]|uniref:Lipoprotein n=3 Tax=Kelleziovirus TaxID=1982236 RepID=A0A140G6E8_9CAUD|nr:hypothetical protein BJD78_gp63 [Arthrobacter phage KellEzio]YP_009303348.1 hypothetical protein BJD77_gp065 [Arthrobacter phage Kitkat]AMM44233.1 hypothetical protein KELLEZIO_63 [Arthrobacter phage KellEzio]AMM44326.1 hypothetical protein KITKAT_65 [Arthrobacter phage Kitkat]QGJ96503.1 hypothetical protein SEA_BEATUSCOMEDENTI_64 [Arthrobacter phage BeatusComedenti]